MPRQLPARNIKQERPAGRRAGQGASFRFDHRGTTAPITYSYCRSRRHSLRRLPAARRVPTDRWRSGPGSGAAVRALGLGGRARHVSPATAARPRRQAFPNRSTAEPAGDGQLHNPSTPGIPPARRRASFPAAALSAADSPCLRSQGPPAGHAFHRPWTGARPRPWYHVLVSVRR